MSIYISPEELKNRKCVGYPPQKHKWFWWSGGSIKECKKCGVKVLKTMSDRTYKSRMKEYVGEKGSWIR